MPTIHAGGELVGSCPVCDTDGTAGWRRDCGMRNRLTRLVLTESNGCQEPEPVTMANQALGVV